MPTPPENRPPETVLDSLYTPLDPLGGDDLPPGRLPDGGQGGEQAEPSRGEQADDDTDNAPAFDAVSSQEDGSEGDLLESDVRPQPGETAPF